MVYVRIFYDFHIVAIVNNLIMKWNGHQAKENLDLLQFKSRIAAALTFQGQFYMKRLKERRDNAPSTDL